MGGRAQYALRSHELDYLRTFGPFFSSFADIESA